MANNFKDRADELKPREKVMAAGNAKGCNVPELLAILLKTGAAGCDVMELSNRIVDAFGTTANLVQSDFAEIRAKVADYNKQNPGRKILGLGPVKMVELAAAFELARRGIQRSGRKPERVSDSSAAARIFTAAINCGEECEQFLMLPLDARQTPLADPIPVASGTANGVNVHPRDVFKAAVRTNACSIIIAHNHPSGETAPSRQDIALTKQLSDAGKMMGIPVLDHLVVTDDESKYYSFRENGKIV